MGIPHLWKNLKSAAAEVQLPEYALQESMKHDNQGDSIIPIVVGIDASIWMNQVHAAFHHPRHAQMGENPELRTLLYKLLNLLYISVIPVFVFDGPHRPSFKRGKHVLPLAHWLTSRFKDFIQALGFHVHNAPGEAEAELAYLNQSGIIDAVMSDDSDTFIFGAECVLRSMTLDKRYPNKFEVYQAAALPLTRGGMLLFALLVGGDYDMHGLPGCGPATALHLAKSGLGDSLLEICQHHGPLSGQASVLDEWRYTLIQELKYNLHGYLSAREPKAAQNIGSSFPRPAILDAYLYPVTSKSSCPQLDATRWGLQQPNIPALSHLCELSFSWGTPSGLTSKFRNLVWPGIIFRDLLLRNNLEPSSQYLVPLNCYHSAQKHVRSKQASGFGCYDFRITVDIQGLIQRMLSGLHHVRSSSDVDQGTHSSTLSLNLPEPLALQYFSGIIEKPQKRKKSIKKLHSSVPDTFLGILDLSSSQPKETSHLADLGVIEISTDSGESDNPEIIDLTILSD